MIGQPGIYCCPILDNLELRNFTQSMAWPLLAKRIAIQGLGNVGYHAAKFCREAGAIIIAIAEREGAIPDSKWLDTAPPLNEEPQSCLVSERYRESCSVVPGTRHLPMRALDLFGISLEPRSFPLSVLSKSTKLLGFYNRICSYLNVGVV
jgi:glutamate/leucine/phenylalanine/valine dehydrogenase